jgi:hypothetical protein
VAASWRLVAGHGSLCGAGTLQGQGSTQRTGCIGLQKQDAAADAECRPFLPTLRRAVYQAGREGAARQEQWWAAGGRAAIMMAPLRQSRGGGLAGAGKRQRTEAARDKENAPRR